MIIKDGTSAWKITVACVGRNVHIYPAGALNLFFVSLDQTSTPIIVHLGYKIKLAHSFMLLEMLRALFLKASNTEIKMSLQTKKQRPAFVSASIAGF